MLLALLAIGCEGHAQAACQPPELAIDAAAVRSRWREFDARGQALLLERGTLWRRGLGVTSNCLGGETVLAWRRTSGSRTYNGLSSVGTSIQTLSRLQADEWQLSQRLPISGPWSVAARLSWHRLNRDLAGVGAVQGYPERYSHWQAVLGARFETPLATTTRTGLLLVADAWLGGGPAGRLDLRLPSADPTRLALGRSRTAELALRLRTARPASGAWHWDVGFEQRSTLLAAGPSGALMRNGALVGGAAQPRALQGELALAGSVSLPF